MQPMQKEDVSYKKAENCETAVNKGHYNVGSCSLRYYDFFTNAFLPLI